MKFSKHLKDFIASDKDFSIVFSTISKCGIITEKTSRIVVLDSSFNPPHLGHYTLAKLALSYNYNTGQATQKQNESTYSQQTNYNSFVDPIINNLPKKLGPHVSSLCTLLLVLSVKNADKIHPQPALFEHRLQMMYLMANYWFKESNVHVSIGITRHARFVDKLVSILEQLERPVKLTFAVGYDTLIRILDEKYYLPDKLLDSLREFMTTSDIFCLTRSSTSITEADQLNLVRDMRNGHLAHIPLSWAQSIHMVNVADSTISEYSSSHVRSCYASGNEVDDKVVIKVINDYIVENKIYE